MSNEPGSSIPGGSAETSTRPGLVPTRWAAGFLVPWVVLLGGCDPIYDIGGAFFPAWIFAAVMGLVATILAREVLVRLGLDDRLFGRGFAYLGFFACVSILTWIWFFRT